MEPTPALRREVLPPRQAPCDPRELACDLVSAKRKRDATWTLMLLTGSAMAVAQLLTYVTLRLIPRIKRSFREFVEEVGPKAMFEQAKLDPAEVMEQLGISGTTVRAPAATRIVFTCEDHGRCVGCPRVLAQFEAIVRHQGEDSFDDVERKCYARLREQLADDDRIEGESETDRQKRTAARVVEALVHEGVVAAQAREVVWAIGKTDRATIASWLTAARERCQQIVAGTAEKDVA